MKKSLSHLPPEKREDLHRIVQYVLEALSQQCEMVILYGSYARGDYVDYDQRIEYGVPTYYMSDYDILIITSKSMKYRVIEDALRKVEERYYREKGDARRPFVTSIQFINESIEAFNKALSCSRYFYSDIKKEGILLYDSKCHKLARRRKLNFAEIGNMAQEYFDDKFATACSFIRSTHHAYNDKDYKIASFYLHQACEHFYRTVILTFTLYGDKTHDLEFFSKTAKSHALDIAKAFPRSTEQERHIFDLLNDAYIQARYNPKFVVTKEDIEAALPQVELLRDITQQVCAAKIAEYRSMVKS